MRNVLAVAIVVCMALDALPAPVYAQQIPNASPCLGITQTGLPVPANQIVGNIAAWAETTWINGYPTIIYGPLYFALPPLIQEFTSVHECGHASTGNPNEFAANCFALNSGRFSPGQIAQIRMFYQSLPGPLAPQYGGSGPGFWAGTIATCPQFAHF